MEIQLNTLSFFDSVYFLHKFFLIPSPVSYNLHRHYGIYETYQEESAKWEETYGNKAKPKQETLHERMQNYQKEFAEQQVEQTIYTKYREAR